MKTIQINEYGGIDVLKLNENASKPVPSKDHVLIKVHAASINPVDWKVREGYLKSMVPLQFPATLGGDFAGVVEEIGEGVVDFKIGDEVFGQAGVLNGGSGAFAELATAKKDKFVIKPKSLDFITAASIPLVGASALQALEEHIKLKSEQKILIHGGAGGIGSIAIQVAKLLGAHVATTTATDDVEFVKSLEADEVIDYKTQAFETILKDFDAVYDTVGGETTNKSFKILKKNGILVSMVGQPDETLAKQYEVIAIGQGTRATFEHFKRLAELLESGKITIHIDKKFSLEEFKEAFEYQEKGHPRGKVVFTIPLPLLRNKTYTTAI